LGAPEPVELTDFVEDFQGLLETEARVAQVAIVWGAVARTVVLADPARLSHRILKGFLDAFQRAEVGSAIEVNIRRNEGVAAVDLRYSTGDPSRTCQRVVQAQVLR
jgi:C4-dicarboxylate-specific signal transduction histidine kinase